MIRSTLLGLILAGGAPISLAHSAVLNFEFDDYNNKTLNSPVSTQPPVPIVAKYCANLTSVVCLSNRTVYGRQEYPSSWISKLTRSVLSRRPLVACDLRSIAKPPLSLAQNDTQQFTSLTRKSSAKSYFSLSEMLPAWDRLLNPDCNSPQKNLPAKSTGLAATPELSSEISATIPRQFPSIARSSLIVSFPQENSSFVPQNTKLANPAPATKRIASGFGWRRRPFSNQLQFHQGIDYGAPLGSPVVAVGSGIVTKVVAGCADFGNLFCGGQLGNWIEIDHGNGRVGTYGHLKRGSIVVKEGMKVSKNQAIAQVGSSGWSTGAHLDFRFKVNGKHENPALHVMTIEPHRVVR